jgi:membrane protease subunit (stomatin/prohibitin family)
MICQFAFFGAVARYMAGEAAPVGKDTFNYMAHGTRDGIRDVTSAIREGLTGETDPNGQIRCSSCQHPNDAEAKFCEQCGYQLTTTRLCSHCDCENDVDAKFCDNCGKPLN